MKTQVETKTIYTIEEAWVHVTYKELKNLYSGYAFVETDCIDNLGYFDSYEEAEKEFSKLQPRLEYDCYNRRYNLYEYQLAYEVFDTDENVLDYDIQDSKDALFVAIDENGEVVEKSEHLKDLIREYELDYIKVVAK